MPLSRLVMLGIVLPLVFVLVAPADDKASKDEVLPAYRPLVRPVPPKVKGAARTDIDRFILAALEARQLTLSPEADRATLIRRVSFDLTGLPPSSKEIEAFQSDKSPDAYEKMVDRYLASPHYGERWGKYWLDAAGYADSNGYFSADTDRPLAWRYRDYVVNSFNADKPYDLFVREQLAGDELAGYIPGEEVIPAMVEKLIATHFLRNAPDGTGESDGNPEEVRADRYTVIEGNIQNIMNCLLGLTVQCARCHDHKFEPISQEEYYSLQAILFPVYNPERWSKPNDRVVQVGSKAEIAESLRKNQQIDRQVQALKNGLLAFGEPLREQFLDERFRDLDATVRTALAAAVKAPRDKRTPAQQALLKKHANAEISDDELASRFPEYAALRERVKLTIAEREKERPRQGEKIAVFVETDPNPPPHHILKRGQHGKPGDQVKPGVIAALTTAKNPYEIGPRPAGRISTGRRTAFAKWITSPDNPLFARVMVNRIWQHHFGTGIVATADNLGASGGKPSHPELLDFLASEFIASRWSVKTMHRSIMTSAVYRQSSHTELDAKHQPHLQAIDPDNRLLSHHPLRRLDAESIRDAMLCISGELDPRAGGRYVPSKRTPQGTIEIDEKTDGVNRRSIYLQQSRTRVVTFLQLFDAPSIVSTCGKRTPSTVPLQSLALLNSDFARNRGKAFARRLSLEAGHETSARLDLAFRLVCGRPPSEKELAHCKAFLVRQQEVYAKEKDTEQRIWTDLCQMLFASNAFLYVE